MESNGLMLKLVPLSQLGRAECITCSWLLVMALVAAPVAAVYWLFCIGSDAIYMVHSVGAILYIDYQSSSRSIWNWNEQLTRFEQINEAAPRTG